MNGYERACRVEASGLSDICSFLEQQCDSGRFVLTDKGRLSEWLQRTVGDAVANKDEKVWSVEFKIEETNSHNNFFLETWSNLSRRKTGWMYTVDADVLLYYFVAERDLYVIGFQNLARWAFGNKDSARRGGHSPGCIYRYSERRQRKHDQLNDTWGRCVPISHIQRDVGLTRYRYSPDHDEWFENTQDVVT